jgi:hypothetical protein
MEEGSEDAEENIDIITSNQTIAFDYQIEQEEARKSAHKDREKTYKLAFGLYSAGVLAAVVEQFMVSTGEPSTCNLDGTKPDVEVDASYSPSIFIEYHFIDKLKPREILEIVFRKLTTIFPKSHAQLETLEEWKSSNNIVDYKDLAQPVRELPLKTSVPKLDLTGSLDNSMKGSLDATLKENASNLKAELAKQNKTTIEVAKEQSDIINKDGNNSIENALKTPWVRGALSGLLAMYSKKIADKAGKLKKQAEKRVELLKELRDGFVATGGAGFEICKDEDRKNPAKVACYCYTKDGDKNPNRETSATCQSFWKTGKAVAATDYSRSNGYTRQIKRGCLKSDGQYSHNCCSDKKEKGKCTKVGGKFNLGQLGGLTGLSDTMKDTASYINGNMATADLNGDQYEQLALNANKNLSKMRKNKKQAPLLKKIDKLRDKMAKNFSAKVRRAIRSGGMSPQLGLGGLGSAPAPIKSAKDVLKSMKDDFAKGSTRRTAVGSRKKGNLGDYDFGSGPSGGIEIDDIAKVMDKNYKIDDINNNSDHDIFKIISNRYHRSGLRRLFDTDGISETDEANGNEIHGK